MTTLDLAPYEWPELHGLPESNERLIQRKDARLNGRVVVQTYQRRK